MLFKGNHNKVYKFLGNFFSSMKTVALLPFVVFLLSFFLVSASESYSVDFSEVRSQAVYLYEDDEVRFSLLDGEHVLIIEEVGSSSVKVDIGPFIDKNTTLYPGLLGLDYIMKLDLDKDGITDLNVALYSISEDGLVHLVLQDATASDFADISGDVGLVDSIGGIESKTAVLLIIGVLVLVLVLFLVFRNNSLFDDTKDESGSSMNEGEKHAHISSQDTGQGLEDKK